MAMAAIVNRLMAEDSARREILASAPRVTLQDRVTQTAITDAPTGEVTGEVTYYHAEER